MSIGGESNLMEMSQQQKINDADLIMGLPEAEEEFQFGDKAKRSQTVVKKKKPEDKAFATKDPDSDKQSNNNDGHRGPYNEGF